MIAKIQEIIETKVRPALQADGGDIELVDVEDGIVKVKMLMDMVPEVKGIEQVF
jgi:Fe-S cluster biogenesis protein NfuA